MAETNSTPANRPKAPTSNVVPLSGETAGAKLPPPPEPQTRPQGHRLQRPKLPLLLAALLALCLVGLAVQTRRISGLTSQVEGLEVQLSAAKAQLATYDARFALIRSSVSDLLERVGMLSELVDENPVAPSVQESDSQ